MNPFVLFEFLFVEWFNPPHIHVDLDSPPISLRERLCHLVETHIYSRSSQVKFEDLALRPSTKFMRSQDWSVERNIAILIIQRSTIISEHESHSR